MKIIKHPAFNYALLALVAICAGMGVIDPATAGVAVLGSVMPQAFPDVNSFRRHMTNMAGQVEVIRQSLYDFQLYAHAGATEFQFFALPQGQGLSASPGNANAVKALTDTNMQMAGALPAPQGFWIQSIEVDFQAGSVNTANTFTPQTLASSAAAPAAATGIVQVAAINDASAVIGAGALVLTVGTKEYLTEAPLFRFPTKARREVDSAFAGNSATTANFGAGIARSGGRPYVLEPGIALQSSQNFNVKLRFPVVVALPSGFNGRIGVVLDGWLFRPVQ